MRYNRVYMRKHYKSDCYISNDGLHAERDYFDPKIGRNRVQKLTMWLDSAQDRLYILVSGKGKFYVDEMVLSCYRGTMKDGKKYMVHHKDGDMRNSNLNNLEWMEETPENLQKRQAIITASIAASAIKDAAAKKQAKMNLYKRNKINVNKNAQITQDGQVVSLEDYFYDPDLDWTFHIVNTRVRLRFYIAKWKRYEDDRINVDEIMEDFGKIAGNKADFAKPVVLYKNHDYLDTTPGNMEWCDESDQRYIDFKAEAHKRKMEKDHQSNYFLSEQSWKTIYGPNEPYQDWSDRPPKRGICFG